MGISKSPWMISFWYKFILAAGLSFMIILNGLVCYDLFQNKLDKLCNSFIIPIKRKVKTLTNVNKLWQHWAWFPYQMKWSSLETLTEKMVCFDIWLYLFLLWYIDFAVITTLGDNIWLVSRIIEDVMCISQTCQ